MNFFTISEMQRFSGIKAHTIRIWEKRYNALKPDRSEGNTRYYNGNQLRRLLNIVSLMETDFKVSELCIMPDVKLNMLIDDLLEKSKSAESRDEFLISQLIASALEFNESQFDKFFSHSLLRHGIKGSYLKVIYPALRRIGLMWSKDELPPSQEHFITNLIRQKLNTSIDALTLPVNPKNTWVLFLPENEYHETGLLLANYLLRQAGNKVIYLGANVPPDSLKLVDKMINPTCVLSFLVRKDDVTEDANTLKSIQKYFPTQKIFLATDASRVIKIKPGGKVIHLKSLEDLEKYL